MTENQSKWIIGLLAVIAVLVFWAIFGQSIMRYFECESMEGVEYYRALVSGYCK